jgi:hypothetical protein
MNGIVLKKTFFVMCILLFVKTALSQSNLDKMRLYEFMVECPIYKCDILGKVIDTTLLIAPPKSKFMLVDMNATTCIIRFTFLNNNKKIGGQSAAFEDYTSYSYYTITKSQLDFKAILVKKSDLDLVVGTVFTPIKVRFAPFDFSKDISVGSTFGVKYTFNQDKQAAVDGLIGFGVSSVTVDSASTKGRARASQEIFAFTPSIGAVLELGNAQVGLFIGLDFVSNVNQIKYEWIYQGKPWISFGIGYSMFSFNLKK